MTNNNLHSALFELQKNLESLSSAKEQVEFFREKSEEITLGIADIQKKYVAHLEDLKLDYQIQINLVEEKLSEYFLNNQEVNKETVKKTDSFLATIKKDYENRIEEVKNDLSEFVLKIQDENHTSIKKIVEKSEETIVKGVEQFEEVSKKVDGSNENHIKAIANLLEHYKNVVDASNTLVEALTKIDFPTKLDAISSKSLLIMESITTAKQALEIKLADIQSDMIDKITTGIQQLKTSNDSGFSILAEKTTEVIDKQKIMLEEISGHIKLTKSASAETKDATEKLSVQMNEQAQKNDSKIKTLTILTAIMILLSIIQIILHFR